MYKRTGKNPNSKHDVDKDSVIAQLTELFGELVSPEIIETICHHTNYNVQNAIDRLCLLSEGDNTSQQVAAEESLPTDEDLVVESETYKQPNSGAISKQMSKSNPNSFASVFSSNNNKSQTTQKTNSRPKDGHSKPPKNFNRICDLIKQGVKVLVILRGAPGSGKSTLARDLLQTTLVSNTSINHILSADDYFIDRHGRYVYEREKIGDAHAFTQNQAEKRMQDGWSPLIVDNTNMKVWEMIPYFRMAVLYGYVIEILEPNTSWAEAPRILAKKNTHQVPEFKLQQMLATYEPTTVQQVLNALKMGYHMQSAPQLRQNPPLHQQNVITATATPMIVRSLFDNGQDPLEWSEKWNDNQNDIDSAIDQVSKRMNLNDIPMPKPPRSTNAFSASQQLQESPIAEQKPVLFEAVDWKVHESESTDFWKAQPQQLETLKQGVISEPQPQREYPEEKQPTVEVPSVMDNEMIDVEMSLTQHQKDCPNENSSFVMLRTIYPTIPNAHLWDLFENCNGDLEWSMEILLKDSNGTDFSQTQSTSMSRELYCDCGKPDKSNKPVEQSIKNNSRVQSPAMKQIKRDKSYPNANDQEVKRAIEQNFVIGEEHYSDHVKRIRDIRRGVKNNNKIQPEEVTTSPTIESEITSDEETEEIVEIELGRELVSNLENMFGVNEPDIGGMALKTNVFMSKSMASQLYALWRESLYNQIEEQRFKSYKEDEELAKHLHAQEKYPLLHQQVEPRTLKERMEMEAALESYRAEVKETWQKDINNDIATQMSREKLYKLFPNVNRETLMEILAAHNNQFEDTIESLSNSLNNEQKLHVTAKDLFEEARKESILVESSLATNVWTDNLPENKILNADEAKRAALKDFENSRNLAAYHSQLKSECYLKAKNAVSRGDNGVALYYSQIANLHKNKIDMANHKAANSIMEVHNLTQKNNDVLDLHYLHAMEATQCLDVFLDKHITQLKSLPYNNKALYIITGRGLHSANGKPTIKLRVKQRLKERGLQAIEANPGLLKVKIFRNSVYSHRN